MWYWKIIIMKVSFPLFLSLPPRVLPILFVYHSSSRLLLLNSFSLPYLSFSVHFIHILYLVLELSSFQFYPCHFCLSFFDFNDFFSKSFSLPTIFFLIKWQSLASKNWVKFAFLWSCDFLCTCAWILISFFFVRLLFYPCGTLLTFWKNVDFSQRIILSFEIIIV